MPLAASPVSTIVARMPLNIVFGTVFIPLLLLRSEGIPSNLVPTQELLQMRGVFVEI
jgi:hypothetical protein